MTDQTPKPNLAEADRWAVSTHEGIDRTDWLHAQAYLALRDALRSIAANTCCDRCQEAALVARNALARQKESK